MDTDRVYIFHVADDDTVIRFITHDFIFDFFPAGYRPFDKNLINRAEFNTPRCYHEQFIIIIGNTAASPPQGEGRPYNDWVADFFSKGHGRRNVFENIAFRYRLIDVFHGFFEEFAVFRFFNSRKTCPQQLYMILFQYAGIGQFDSHIQSHLAPQCRQQTVRTFLFDDFCHIIQGNRFYINPVGDVFIGHDSRRITIDQDDFQSFFFQGPAGLGTGIVKFSSLTDNNRARTDNEYFL